MDALCIWVTICSFGEHVKSCMSQCRLHSMEIWVWPKKLEPRPAPSSKPAAIPTQRLCWCAWTIPWGQEWRPSWSALTPSELHYPEGSALCVTFTGPLGGSGGGTSALRTATGRAFRRWPPATSCSLGSVAVGSFGLLGGPEVTGKQTRCAGCSENQHSCRRG